MTAVKDSIFYCVFFQGFPDFKKVKHRHIYGIDLSILDGNRKNQINCVPAMPDGNGNYQKEFRLFGTGMGINKNPSRYLERDRETQKSLPAVREWEFKAFPLINLQEREFPLMPAFN